MKTMQPTAPPDEQPAPLPAAQPEDGRTMRAAVLSAARQMDVRDVPRPQPAPHEVLVRVQAVGICGTDLQIFAGHANYSTDSEGRPVSLATSPQILGHEIAGVVTEVGAEVDDVAPGECVVIDQGRTCVGERIWPRCEYCGSGDSHQCERYREHGITGLPGGFAEFVAVPAANAIRLPQHLDPTLAAITEPVACVIHALEVLGGAPARYRLAGEDPERRIRTVLVCGAGPSGLLFIQYLRAVLGFDGLLLVSEPNPRKRALAERFGAETIDPAGEDLVESVRARTRGRRVELLVEASGVGEVIAQTPRLLRKQGTLLLYGHGHSGVDLSVLNNVQFLEPTLLAPVGASGGFEPDGRPTVFVRALRMIEAGLLDVASLVTHRYPSLEAVCAAFAGCDRDGDYIKGVLTIPAAP